MSLPSILGAGPGSLRPVQRRRVAPSRTAQAGGSHPLEAAREPGAEATAPVSLLPAVAPVSLGDDQTLPEPVYYDDVDDEFPPRNPFHQPEPEVCVVPMTTTMRDMEGCLQRALIVWVGGTQPSMSM